MGSTDRRAPSGTRGEIARLLHRLGWSTIAACVVVGGPGRMVLGLPASLVAADCLRQLAPLLAPAGRRHMEWAAITAGGAATAALLSWIPSASDAADAAYIVVGSITVSLYALGLAAWVAPVDEGHLARRLRASVIAWGIMLVIGAVGCIVGSPDASASDSGAFFAARSVPDWVSFVILGLMIVAYILLAGAHHVVKSTMRELAIEDQLTAHPRNIGTA